MRLHLFFWAALLRIRPSGVRPVHGVYIILCFTGLAHRNNAYSLYLHVYVSPPTARRLGSEGVAVPDL